MRSSGHPAQTAGARSQNLTGEVESSPRKMKVGLRNKHGGVSKKNEGFTQQKSEFQNKTQLKNREFK